MMDALRRRIGTPLARLRSIKLKISIIIVLAIAVTAATSQIGFRLGWPVWIRPFVATAILMVLVQWLAFGLTRPLREMETVASDMARGEHARRIVTESVDEIGRLAAAFNTMTAELEATDRLRRDLVANAAHELRTPIAALQATIENAVDGITELDDRGLAAMHAQVARLGRLVNDLLDLSRLEAGVAPLRIGDAKVAELVDAALDAVAIDPPPAVLLTDSDLVARVDADRIVQVLVNLLDNAARHGGDRIELAVTASAGMLRITVDDDGPGIAPGHERLIFERFAQIDGGGGGSGLGLTIVRWIAELHGGSVCAESRVAGARFVVELPL
jgi:two-component system, OmpR family, sensor histidine kinase BaeS